MNDNSCEDASLTTFQDSAIYYGYFLYLLHEVLLQNMLSTKETILFIVPMINSTITSSIIALFACLGFVASFMLQDLCEDISKTKQNLILSATFNLEDQLRKWKRCYQLICKYIERLNVCFGLILLIYLTKSFISFITFSFSVVVDIQKGVFFSQESLTIVYVTFFISSWCYLIAIVVVSNRIKSQVK